MSKCDTYDINPTTVGMGFKGICKSTLAVLSIPVGLSIITIIIGLLLTFIF